MNTAGRKEVAEAVFIAVLSALCGELITWGAEECKRIAAARSETKKKKPAEDEEETP